MLFRTIFWLCAKLKPFLIHIKTSLNDIFISSELTILPNKVCCVWTSTCDFKQRKLNYPVNYHYGLDLQINRKTLHVILLILLAGDVATNPGPNQEFTSYYEPKIMATNVRSLVSKMSEVREFLLRNYVSFAFVTETWLKSLIPDSVIDVPGYSILRRTVYLIIMGVSVST